jgi:hypothetical protein
MFSVADPRCLSRIRIFPSWIQGKKDSESRIRIHIKKIKVFLILKIVSKLSEKLSGMFIPDPDFFPSRIPHPDPGSRIRIPDAWVKKEPYPGSGTLLTLTENLANFVNK